MYCGLLPIAQSPESTTRQLSTSRESFTWPTLVPWYSLEPQNTLRNCPHSVINITIRWAPVHWYTAITQVVDYLHGPSEFRENSFVAEGCHWVWSAKFSEETVPGTRADVDSLYG